MSRTLRVAVDALSPGERTLAGDAAHYALKVHRLAAGDRFVAFDPDACLEADATVLGLGRESLTCRIEEPRPGLRADLAVTLVQCLGKGDKVDEVVRSATALGVTRVVLCQSERSVVKLGARAGARRERWLAIAVDAARQSGRGDLPEIMGPLSLDEALSLPALPDELKVCLHPRAEASFAGLLTGARDRALALLVGPEGGLSEQELARARAHGYTLASFGRFELRTELAGVAALGAVLAFRAAHALA